MVTGAVSNLGLDSVGMLLSSIPKWSPIVGVGRRGSSRAVGLGSIGRGERGVGPANDERLKAGVSLGFLQRWGRRRRIFDGAATFRATAADDVEQEEEVEEEEEETEEEPASSERDRQLASRETSKISGTEQQQKRSNGRKRARKNTPSILSSIVAEWTSFTSVREKGDVRDVVLMSLSFAVLIYISQHLVHAYCALRHMYYNHY